MREIWVLLFSGKCMAAIVTRHQQRLGASWPVPTWSEAVGHLNFLFPFMHHWLGSSLGMHSARMMLTDNSIQGSPTWSVRCGDPTQWGEAVGLGFAESGGETAVGNPGSHLFLLTEERDRQGNRGAWSWIGKDWYDWIEGKNTPQG